LRFLKGLRAEIEAAMRELLIAEAATVGLPRVYASVG
jgi:hypothetical protein